MEMAILKQVGQPIIYANYAHCSWLINTSNYYNYWFIQYAKLQKFSV